MDNLTDQQVKCKECRECCEYVEYPVSMLSVEVVEYFLWRGETFYIDPKSGVFSIRSYKPCQHLGPDGCLIYDTRPETCRVYMCDHKDKGIKDAKDRICASTMEQVSKSLELHKKEKTNGL